MFVPSKLWLFRVRILRVVGLGETLTESRSGLLRDLVSRVIVRHPASTGHEFGASEDGRGDLPKDVRRTSFRVLEGHTSRALLLVDPSGSIPRGPPLPHHNVGNCGSPMERLGCQGNCGSPLVRSMRLWSLEPTEVRCVFGGTQCFRPNAHRSLGQCPCP